MHDNSIESFEAYRRQRQRHRRLAEAEHAKQGGPNNALRELEAVEAREHRDQQLQREVHDFFDSATRTAAEIVQKVTESAKLQIDERLSTEMHEFLFESLTRMQDLVSSVISSNSSSSVEEFIEPLMHNLKGHVLDGFRRAGAVAEEHLGQDPLQTDLEDVRRDFQSKMPGDHVPHVPAETMQEADQEIPGAVEDTAPEEAYESEEVHETGEHFEEGAEETEQGYDEPEDEEPAAVPAPAAPEPQRARTDHARPKLDTSSLTPEQKRDLQRFKKALETLVRQGNMSKDEARAAWDARKATLFG